MSGLTDLTRFNRPLLVQGWYWLLPSHQLAPGQVRAVELAGRPLALWRSASGQVRAFDAHCPHMGAHLAEGRVEGEGLRCFFHDWRFEADGRCSDIPCLGRDGGAIAARSWPVEERHGLIWIWPGRTPGPFLPLPPELADGPIRSRLGNRFVKGCHPNVVMVNAIDEHHFRTVHKLPGHILSLAVEEQDAHTLRFRNRGRMPADHWLGRLLGRFYRDTLHYETTYWYGHCGVASFGPDFLHLHVLFALRRTPEGRTEGWSVALTRRHAGPLGWLRDRAVLALTRLGARYFAHGDTRVFQTIRFDFRNPTVADRSVIAFIRHYERQPLADWDAA
ncbi:aromatic ring-hydroxylating oxygenase subunit alpha [Chitinimonas koreensis]|uniref:aromatic ring-hydroxylating oxygenase subunit alpha n=1 Tax=Chitinimonas koreensis TaxID=356302 RepID=UPI0003F8C614|nr:aromatic ring-hydroxylating dioxygenase subunit alpha [Chitinimonas koreensis]QNM94778.1 aromatic ring-hydroxylating dioxygenase subunit alpha [Chitinimonas koreensis]